MHSNNPLINITMIKSEIMSALASTGIVLASNGSPESTMFAAAVQPLLTKAFDVIIPDIFHKNLTKREVERLGISYKAAVSKINENAQRGIRLRDDNLFLRSGTNYSKADDIIEAIFKNAIDDTEQKKTEFYGYFFGNLAFCPEVDYSNAMHLQRTISQLSYTHLCLIKYIYINTSLPAYGWKNKINRNTDMKGMEIYHAVKDLVRLDITIATGSVTLGEEIGNIELSCIGKALYKIMDLDKICNEDFNDVSNIVNRIKS
jgi:hypothetical protein|nr:MAG TPA: hypothetical protein [Caudoviricetes sp.]